MTPAGRGAINRGARPRGAAAGARAGAGGSMGSRRAPGAGGRAGAGGDGEDDGPVWTPSPASRSYLLSLRPAIR